MGNIIGNRIYVGSYEADKIYLGSDLVYEKKVILSMPGYNNGVAFKNSLGTVAFTGGANKGGWIGYDEDGGLSQKIVITPFAESLHQNFFISFDALRVLFTSEPSDVSMRSISIESDQTYYDEASEMYRNSWYGMYLEWYKSQKRNAIDYQLNGQSITLNVLATNNNNFTLGCYVDTVAKQCYLGIYHRGGRYLSFPSPVRSLGYNNSISIEFVISALGALVQNNYYKNITIEKIRDVDLADGTINDL